jgi:hypothetical protein
VTSPSNPATGETISFVAPIDGKIYDNAEAAAEIYGNPLISVDSTNHTVTVTFTPPASGPNPGVYFVSGIDGEFGPLAAGSWVFQIFTNSGSLALSTNFDVGATALGIALAGDQVVLCWPALGSNFVLQTATNLSTGSWSNITDGIATSGTNYVFTNDITCQAAYFRLQAGQ